MPRFASLACLAIAVCSPALAAAQGVQSWGTPRIDPHADMLFAHRARFGETIGVYHRSERFERAGVMPVVVRFGGTAPPSQRVMAALQALGVRWMRAGRPMASGAYGALVDERAMRALEREPAVARVEVDLPLRAPAPLDLSQSETRTDAVRRAVRAMDGTFLDGRGTTIADIDTPIFIFHPALFRADAGIYPWIDVDGDGVFEPGSDAVDLDRDGVAAPAERLEVIFATSMDRSGRAIGARPTTFRPDRDWVYVDTNGNSGRDYGEPFEETTPAYGEPMFVADDANHNGRLDVSERLMRLGTSKIRGVLSRSEYQRGAVAGGTIDPLVLYNVGDDAQAFERSGHATGVAGILVGGVPDVSRWLGLAPGADLLEGDHYTVGDSQGASGTIQWAIDSGANVILTEYAPYANATLDGTSEEELLLDAAMDQNIVPVSPAGNLADGYKHVRVRLGEGETLIPAHTDGQFSGATFIQFSMHHRSPTRTVSIAVLLPNGRRAEVALSTRGMSIGDGITAYSYARTSRRGTLEHHVVLHRAAGHLEGDYSFAITLDAGAFVDADFYVGDDKTSWGGGFTFVENEPSHTICHPSTSARTLSVGAYVLHTETGFAPWGPRGQRARYSSQGPLITGEPGLEISAPDNPMSLSPVLAGRVPYGATTPFGGTSGAGPHVAAVAALLRQRFPAESGEDIRTRIMTHARHDEFATPDALTLFGAGKLDAAGAFELTDPAGDAPVLTVRAPAESLVGASATVSLEVTDDEAPSALRARWDTDYDGTPDTEWVALDAQSVPTPALGFAALRVEVRDGQGHVTAGTARIAVVQTLTNPPDAGSDGGTTPGTGAGCGCTIPGTREGAPQGAIPIALAAFAAFRLRRRRIVTRR